MSQIPLPKKEEKKKKSGKKLTPHALFSRRLTILASVFIVVCIVYLSILITLQVTGNAYMVYRDKTNLPDGLTEQTVTIQAMRGEIYDRNGLPLVTNRYSYDLTLDYQPFFKEMGVSVRNKTLLSLVEPFSADENGKLCEDSFPLSGTYPDLSYSDEAMDTDSKISKRLNQVLIRNELSTNASAGALVSYYVNKYSLGARIDGIPAYTDEQITTLIRLYYDMDVRDFGGNAAEYVLASNVSAAVISANKENAISGVRVVVRSERIYHYPGYASHILGRVNKIFAEDWDYYNALGYPMDAIVGVSGCESAFEHILHGTDGQMKILVDENGRTVSSEIIKQPAAGQDVRLTIDIRLQIVAEDALRERLELETSNSRKGAVVVTDPDSGAYLAIASAPTFDASSFSEDYEDLAADKDLPMFNRALSGVYYPGKLMQLRTALAGLNENIVTPSSLWKDQNALTVDGYTVICPLLYMQDDSHGYLGVSTALIDGCDVFFGQLGLKIGQEKLQTYETMLGFGQATGIEIAEGEGSISSFDPNRQLPLFKAAIGESDLTSTPAQLCSAFASIVNGGTRYRGHLLYEIRNFTSGDVVQKTPKELLSFFTISQENKQLLIRAMGQMAQKDAILSAQYAKLKPQGVSFGCIGASAPSGTSEPAHAVLLAFGTPEVQTSGNQKGSIAVCVVLENEVYPNSAASVVTAVMDAFYQ
ncbi:MAG: hypothetical protein E7605_03390 [Ruminococcaceae bacterium]|nr:hypothetical protein [Oscillospiraceae bacterium]